MRRVLSGPNLRPPEASAKLAMQANPLSLGIRIVTAIERSTRRPCLTASS